MLFPEDRVGLRRREIEELEHLKPELLQSASVRFEKVEIITDRGQNFIKLDRLIFILFMNLGENGPLNAFSSLHIFNIFVRYELA